MNEIVLSKEEFKSFNQYDQFGFFYDDEGMERPDADLTFNDDVDKLFGEFDSIIVDEDDNIFGIKNMKRTILMEFETEAYLIAREVKEYKDENF